MSHHHLFKALDRSLRDLMRNDLPFSKKLFILGGDFRQILPIVHQGQWPNILDAASQVSVVETLPTTLPPYQHAHPQTPEQW